MQLRERIPRAVQKVCFCWQLQNWVRSGTNFEEVMQQPCPERGGRSTARWSALKGLLGVKQSVPNRTGEAEEVPLRVAGPQWLVSVGLGRLLLT